MSDAEPLISVIITAYNRKEYLRQAVYSALNQTLPKHKYEIILTKNFETEHDKEWEKRGVKLIWFDGEGIGPRVADALQYCKGRIIAPLDDDDWWEPNKLEHVARLLIKDSNIIYYHHSMIFEFEKNLDEAWRREVLDFSREWKRVYPWHNESSTIIAKRVLTDKIEYAKKIPFAFDAFLFFAAHLTGGKLAFEDIPLTHFRVTATQHKKRADKRRKDLLLIRKMIAESDNKKLKYYDQLVLGNLTYWDCAEKIKDGQNVSLREFFAYTTHCVKFRPIRGFRRWLILGVGLFSPMLASRAYKGRFAL